MIILRKITDVLSALVLTATIISAAVVLTLGASKPLYYFDIDYLHIQEDSGYEKEEIWENYNALIDYNLSPFIKKLEFPTFPMSKEAEIHFAEVKEIFQGFLWMFVIGIPVSVMVSMMNRRHHRLGYLKLAGILTIALPILLGILVAVNWDRAFVLFHEIAFDNDYWLFHPDTDPVITILPDAFFLHCAVMILVLVAIGAGICIWRWRRKNLKTSLIFRHTS